MPTFDGSLQIAGDAGTKMPAGIRVDGGRLTILAGPSEEIGSWSLGKLDIRRKSGAFVLTVEGEQLLISVDDPDSFVRLVTINDDAQPPAPVAKERRSRKQQKKARPPKEPRAKKSRKSTAPLVPTAEPEPAPPAEEPKPVPSYLVEPTPAATPPPPPSIDPGEAVEPKKKKAAKPPKAKRAKKPKKTSLFAALPLSWKIGALLVVLAIVLGIFATSILTAILMLTGMLTLLLAVMVGTDSIIAARLPTSLTPTNTLVAGVILLVLSALLMVIS